MLVPCTHCGSPRMRIYDDTKYAGNWHYCPSCKSSGDMIELAARTWKCSLQQAVTRLTLAGVPFPEGSDSDDSVAAYEKTRTGAQQRARDLLAKGSEDLALGRINPSYIIQQLGLLKDQDKPYWRRRMGRFMGACAATAALCLTRPATASHGRLSSDTKFRGKGWHDVVAIPFHDLPGRCAGYLFIGRLARPGQDYECITLDNDCDYPERKTEIGLCMYDVLDNPTAYSELFGNTVFVFNDPIHAFKLQSRHMRDADLPLPLVSTYNAKIIRQRRGVKHDWELVTRELWKTRPDKKFVFWSATVSPDVFNNAARADGTVYICKSLLVTSRNPGHIWLQIVERQARPWMEVLEHELLAMPEQQACDFMANLDLPAEALQRFQHGCADKLRLMLERNRAQVRTVRVATVNNKRIIETPNGWLIEKTGETISNVILRIDKIVAHDDEDDPYYVGRLIYGDKVCEFTASYSRILGNARHSGKWVHNKTIKCLGVAPIIKRTWDEYLLDIARQFHEPQVVREDGKFGWKPNESCFSLPQFAIHVGGSISRERAHVMDDCAPGTRLFPPDTPPPDIVKMARECVQNELFWAMAACIGANVIAPALGHGLANIGIVGHTRTGLAYAIARRAGCASIEPANALSRPNEFVDQLDEAMRRHNWPIMLRTMQARQSRRGLERWLNSTCTANGIAILPGPLPLLAAVVSPWRFVNVPADVDLSAEAQLYGDLIFPLWLQRICSRKLELQSDSPELSLQVLDDMAAMMEDLGGNGENIRAASRHIDDASAPEEAGRRVATLLHTALEEGVARFVVADGVQRSADRMPKIIQTRSTAETPGGIFVGNESLGLMLDSLDLFIPSPGAITDALTTANALECRCEYNGESGWLIAERWWHQQIARCRAGHKRLTVIGGA